jgi:hypothetical protein
MNYSGFQASCHNMLWRGVDLNGEKYSIVHFSDFVSQAVQKIIDWEQSKDELWPRHSSSG